MELTLDKVPRRVLAKIDLQTAFMASRCVLAAERLQLFRKLHGKELTAAQIGRLTGLHERRREVFLAALVALGLLARTGNRYRNTALADRFYVKERSIYWTRAYSDECTQEYEAFSALEDMLTTGRDYEEILGIKRLGYVDRMQREPQFANDFTHMLYYHHQPEAQALARMLDLGGYRRLLDLGGGSGVMSIALAGKYPQLHACVLDFEPVCRVARKITRREGLAQRITVYPCDYTKEIPSGFDVIMSCDSGGDSPDVLGRCYESLPDRGLFVLVDKFQSEDLTTPLFRLMWQLRSARFWLVTKKEAVERVRQAGFVGVKSRRILPDVWMITGRKPHQRRRV
jgi:predicted O-methyltransferase YrrM